MNGKARRRPKALLAYDPARNPDTLGATQRARLERLVNLERAIPIQDFTTGEARAALADCEIVITGWGAPHVSAQVLAEAPKLRLIAHLAGSVKDLIDPSAWERGILVTSAASANAEPVAEYTLAAILFGNKHAFELRDLYRRERRSLRPVRDYAAGIGNLGKTIGLIGASRVGRRVIARLEPFDFAILVADPYLSPAEAGALGVRLVELDELLRESDVVSLHAPATAQTRRLLDRRRLGLMRPGALLINTARGSLVDHDALIDATRDGRLRAILDVTDPEPLPADSPLYDMPGVFLTPHIAGAQGGEVHRLTDSILDEIERYAAGEPLVFALAADELEYSA